MKEFILVIYVVMILVLPQLYTWFVRKTNGDSEAEFLAIAIGFLVLSMLLYFSTQAMIHWEIISFNFN